MSELPDEVILSVVALVKQYGDGHHSFELREAIYDLLSASNTLIEEQAARIAELEKYREMADGYGKLDADYAIAEARLSEAVKVLEEAIPLLDEAADKLEAEGMWGTSERDMAIRAKAFITTLGGDKE